MPFTVVIGEEEVAQGKVKIKEMGLREGHPEKEGILINLVDVATEVKQRLRRKADLENLFTEAEGLRVVDGIKGEAEKLPTTESAPVAQEEQAPSTKTSPAAEYEQAQTSKVTPVAEPEKPVDTPAVPEASKASDTTSVPDPEKPATETPMSQEAIGAVPAS